MLNNLYQERLKKEGILVLFLDYKTFSMIVQTISFTNPITKRDSQETVIVANLQPTVLSIKENEKENILLNVSQNLERAVEHFALH